MDGVATDDVRRRPGRPGWWAAKARQTWRHLTGRVTPAERAALEAWLSPRQLALFDAMHRADRRHGLDVVATLRSNGVADRDLLLAGLLHDAGKGDTGLLPRIVWSLGEALGDPVVRLAARSRSLGPALGRLRRHAERSAELAEGAGCPRRTVALIREQAAPRDPVAGRLLLAADEAN
ncbi:MAG: hypothetical protein RL338_1199 [Chloroflexota bacterium]